MAKKKRKNIGISEEETKKDQKNFEKDVKKELKEPERKDFWKDVKFPLIEKIMTLFDNKSFKFIFFFAVFIIIFYILFLIFVDKISFVREFVALNVGFLLNLFGIKAITQNSIISMGNFSMEVIFECTPLFTMLIFFACVLAYPTNKKAKIKGILFGGILIYFIDILRLFSLAIIGKMNPEIFNYIHTYLWQITLIIVILAIWLFWIDKFTKVNIQR
ncbi:MAG: hypothetical protein GW779_06740 [Candidatus Altiarchaeum hamiconexum]|uniref:Exosortase/archaeosortase family protein n=1 Tax=Candidatus Altarchaeum hamiconexum TaxID=1803513 RepID=A0A8J8CHL8_9ARCH|nr:hypothetical protein [Candidatus Altarchaeum hamiconexum]PIV28558.1 MAG: hypothetical protein COS36_01785 [Candidatus Altarchaeum sp. CG03_land_8_20_14_0_80_32_618]